MWSIASQNTPWVRNLDTSPTFDGVSLILYFIDIVQEIAQCAMQYKTNQCATNPIPALLHQCGLWETCMNRDPTKVGRAKVGAELIAEVVNGFVEPISWKTLVSFRSTHVRLPPQYQSRIPRYLLYYRCHP